MGSVVLAAGTGALVSTVVTEIGKWRERAARQRELLLTCAIDISKSWVGRIASVSKSNAALSELMAIECVHEVLRELFEEGQLSDKNRNKLKGMLDKLDKVVTPSADKK